MSVAKRCFTRCSSLKSKTWAKSCAQRRTRWGLLQHGSIRLGDDAAWYRALLGSEPPAPAFDVAVDSAGNVYVTGSGSDNAFKFTPGGTITEIIDNTGDGLGNSLSKPSGIAVGPGSVYVSGGQFGNNAFKITTTATCSTGGTPCMITEIIDILGDGDGNLLNWPGGIALDAASNAYVTGSVSDNAFKITQAGTIGEIIDSTGDGTGNELKTPLGIAVDSGGNVYVVSQDNSKAFRIAPTGPSGITQIIDATGDGAGNILGSPRNIAVDAAGNAYVSGTGSNNVFKIAAPPAPPPIPTVSDFGIVVLLLLTAVTGVIVIRTAREPGGADDRT